MTARTAAHPNPRRANHKSSAERKAEFEEHLTSEEGRHRRVPVTPFARFRASSTSNRRRQRLQPTRDRAKRPPAPTSAEFLDVRGLSFENTPWSVGCSQNSLTTRNGRLFREYPQVKRGSTHSRSGAIWSQFMEASLQGIHVLLNAGPGSARWTVEG
jgi:hypothetical protein